MTITAEELAAAIGRPGDGQGCTRANNGKVEIQLGDGNWYTLADTLEFIHRHMKSIDEAI